MTLVEKPSTQINTLRSVNWVAPTLISQLESVSLRVGCEPNGRLSASTEALRTALDNVTLFHEKSLYCTNLVKCVTVSAHGVGAQIRVRRLAAPGPGVKVEFAKSNLVISASQYLQPRHRYLLIIRKLSLNTTATAARWLHGGDIRAA